MSETISTRVRDEIDEHIEQLAEHHSISKSKAIRLVLLDGIRAREMRLRFEQMDAKLDFLIENLSGERMAADAVEDRFERVLGRGLPGGTS